MLLIISPVPALPANAGSKMRVLALLRQLKQHNKPFHFLQFRYDIGDEFAMIAEFGADHCTFIDYPNPRHWKHHWRDLARRFLRKINAANWVVPFAIDEICDEQLSNQIKQSCKHIQPTAVQIEYVYFSKLFECFDKDVLKILDVHDIFANRHKMFLAEGRRPEWLYSSIKQENLGFKRADVLLAIQEGERRQIKERIQTPVVTVGHFVDINQHPPSLPNRIVFIGSSNGMNRHGCERLFNEIWPIIHHQYPPATLHIFGSVCDHLEKIPEGVTMHGYADNLNEVYSQASLIIAPLWIGTGLKIKSIEALGHGKALLCAPAAAEGLEDGSGRAFYVAEDPMDFARSVIELLTNRNTAHLLEQNALAYAAAWNQKYWQAYDGLLP